MIQELVEKLKNINILEKDFDDIFEPMSREEFIEKKLSNCTKNSDGTYSCKGTVDLTSLNLTKLPVKFKEVGGSFFCHNNKLKTLEGAPKKVGVHFHCGYNELRTLKGAPGHVGKSFNCHDNRLITLKGAPKRVSGNFNCYNNNLTSLKGAPEIVDDSFNCTGNIALTSLEGAPKKVGGYFSCSYNVDQRRKLLKTIERDYLK